MKPIVQISLDLTDIDEALEFYGRFFHFTLQSRSETMAFIEMGDQFPAGSMGPKVVAACEFVKATGSTAAPAWTAGATLQVTAVQDGRLLVSCAQESMLRRM